MDWRIVLEELKQGNERFRASTPLARPENLSVHLKGQEPKAAVLSCSDSRVPSELIFNQGIGDLFIVRVAGNIATSTQIGSLEFAVEVLHCPLIVVLGHGHCGAVEAALAPADQSLPDHLIPILADIRTGLGDVTDLDQAIHSNVQHTIAELLHHSTLLQTRTEAGSLGIVGAVYDIGSGQVEFQQD